MSAPQIGVFVYSASIRHDDGTGEYPGTPVGGVVVDRFERPDPLTGELVEQVKTVESYRGRIEYHTLAVDDLEESGSGSHVRKDVLRDLSRMLSADMAKKGGGDHLPALLAMSIALNGAAAPAPGPRRLLQGPS
jgi:hypothetical protein